MELSGNLPLKPLPSGDRPSGPAEAVASPLPVTDQAILSGSFREPAMLDRKSVLAVAARSQDAPVDHVVDVTDATVDDFIKNAHTTVFLEFFNPT